MCQQVMNANSVCTVHLGQPAGKFVLQLDFPLLHDQANIWPDWFQFFGQTERKSRVSNIYYTDTYQAIMAARAGQGVALAEYYEVATDLATGRLVRMHDQTIARDAGGYVVMPPEAQQSLRSRVFVDFIDQHLLELSKHFSYPVSAGY